MISEDHFRELLTRSENETLDFKREPHRLDNDYYRSKCIKDIIAMANTPRTETSYIIIGVQAHADGTKDRLGVTEHPDDNDLQSLFGMTKPAVEPRPRFGYYPLVLDGVSYGVIDIPIQIEGPFLVTRCEKEGVLRERHLYFRRGSQNAEANQREQDQIYRWFHEEQDRRDRPTGEGEPIRVVDMPNWGNFYNACHQFDPNRLYLLVVGPQELQSGDAWKPLARLPISLVLDFDPLTSEKGLFAAIGPELKKNRSVHLLTRGDDYDFVPERACYWYGARGLQGREDSLVQGDWRQWNRDYGSRLEHMLETFAQASGGRLLTVIILWSAHEYVSAICTAVDRFFGDAADYVFAFPTADTFQDLATRFGGEAVPIRTENVLEGIADYCSSTQGDDPLADATIPTRDGTPFVLSKTLLSWLSEDLEVLHSRIESGETEDREYHYLQGAEISWSDLSNHWDADRDARAKIQRFVERELGSRNAQRLNLYHPPGAGGTTLARRIGWELRQHNPVVLLRRVVPGGTVDRLQEMFGATELPLLAIVEGADVTQDRLEALYAEVRIRQIPIVFLSVIRKFETASALSKRTMNLPQVLSIAEGTRFVEAFKRLAPDKATALEHVRDGRDERDRTPFYFALTAFGKRFIGLTPYVKSRLDVASPTQREVVTFLALAHYYGHSPVLSQVFAVHLGYAGDRHLRLERVLEGPQLELLVQESDCRWRPAHHLISEEILQLALSENSTERRNWKWQLSAHAIEFIRVCRMGTHIPYDALIDLMRRIFILRDENELLGTEASASGKFARLIEDIPTLEGGLSVLNELVASFPDESHFWGHLGRYYARKMREFGKAVEAIDKAISLADGDDPVLYHMKGMAYRGTASDRIKQLKEQYRNSGEKPSPAEMQHIRSVVEEAETAFAEARRMSPDSEHGYISPIQMMLEVLDFGFQVSGHSSHAEFLVSLASQWYREQLDKVEDLMDHTKDMREGEKMSSFAVGCQADLDRIYDDYDRAIQGWTNLLDRRDVYAPPVRRHIARAYVARRGRNWSSMPPRDIERIVDLMQENLREEPGSDHSIRLWFQAYRHSSRQDIDVALDRLATWRAIGDAQDAHFYLYILHVLKAIEGSIVERECSKDLIQQSADRARHRRDRTRSNEWLGDGDGLHRLLHHSELGKWNTGEDFYERTSGLARVEGHVSDYKSPAAGTIEYCGLPVFFVPSKARARDRTAGITRDQMNLPVRFFLGFSYDGLRAWRVEESGE